MIVVEKAPPYLTVQDTGRPGYRAAGVPRSGAMDQWSPAVSNLLVGNRRNAAALEWAIGGGSLRFESDATISLTGADVEATIDDRPASSYEALEVKAGEILTIHRLSGRRFLYISVRGGIECPSVLGSRSTYLPAALGGLEGRRLVRGDRMTVGPVLTDAAPLHATPQMLDTGPDYDASVIRVILAAESNTSRSSAKVSADRPNAAVNGLLDGAYTVSLTSDRTGYRLEGDHALDAAETSITSEPVCAGVIQLPPSGHPIVLMADSPTIGGYRILATVISCDLPIVAQSLPGRELRFGSVPVELAQRELQVREKTLADWDRSVAG